MLLMLGNKTKEVAFFEGSFFFREVKDECVII